MIYDCFTFYNELDLLEIRLRLLDQHVDRFVLVESNRTYAGKEKPLIFDGNRQRFSRWLDRIITVSPPAEAYANAWFSIDWKQPFPGNCMEALHRNELSSINPHLKEDDLIMQSDVDEVPDPLAFDACKHLLAEGHQCIRLAQKNHYFFVNYGRGNWPGTIFMTAGFFKAHLPHKIRVDETLERASCPNAGWHWSFLGGIEGIRAKLAAYTHYNLFKPPFNDPAHIQNCLETGKDLFDRGQNWQRYDMSAYRQDVREILEEYPHFISNGRDARPE